MAPSALDQLDEARTRAAGDEQLIAIGWATVDLDRAALELAGLLGVGPEAFVPVGDSVTLGGRCRVATDALIPGLSLVILEPTTEGRLAGRLARLGEGPVAVWLPAGPAAAVGAHVSRGQPGPFGSERLIAGGPSQGPYRILVLTAPGTIPP
jgi:hypothetical protein